MGALKPTLVTCISVSLKEFDIFTSPTLTRTREHFFIMLILLQKHFGDESSTTVSWLPFKNTEVLLDPCFWNYWPENTDPQTQSATHPELKQTPDSHQGHINERADVLQGTKTNVCAWKVFNVFSCRVHFSYPATKPEGAALGEGL